VREQKVLLAIIEAMAIRSDGFYKLRLDIFLVTQPLLSTRNILSVKSKIYAR
jgi:hypothetical protein